MNETMKKTMKKLAVVGLIGFLIIGGTACGQSVGSVMQEDILTQTKLTEGKIPVTVLVKYAFSANAFEKEAEKQFPELDIIQVGNYTANTSNELEQRMAHDDLTDLIFTWPQQIGEQYFEERLLDLSGMPFTGRYNLNMLNLLSEDGKLYYLPGPAQLRGIVYNKTMFQEHGWSVPNNFEEFVSLCREIEAAGIRPLQLSLKEAEVIETAFIGFGYNGSFSTPSNTQLLKDFNQSKSGDFGDFSKTAFDNFQVLLDEGILKAEDLEIKFSQRIDRLFSRQCAMVSDGANVTRMGLEWSNCADEFGVMPFLGPSENEDWGQLYLVCYIGINKHLAEEQNKEKYDLVMKLMDYISSREGQAALAGDDGGMVSSVTNVPLPSIPEIKDMRKTLDQGRYALFPRFEQAQSALHEGLSGMLAGTLSSEDVIRMVNEQNANPLEPQQPILIGKAEETFSLIETGNYITDTMREKSGADIALFLDNGKDGKFNAKGVSAKFYQGDITIDDVELRVLPVLQHGERGVMQVISISGENLLQVLEHSLKNGGWFYYFSGLRMEYDPTAEAGKRIRKISDSAGIEIDLAKVYKVAIMDGSVPEEYMESCEETDLLISELLIDQIKNDKIIRPNGDGRFTVY